MGLACYDFYNFRICYGEKCNVASQNRFLCNSEETTNVQPTHKLYYTDAVFASLCICPGDILTYECTVTGGHATVWTGSAFDCPSAGNDITLLHSHFMHKGSCNNGTIMARSLSVKGNNYTSQFNVTVASDMAGKTIECLKSNGTHDILLLSFVIPTILCTG